jgi:hypothetical protein
MEAESKLDLLVSLLAYISRSKRHCKVEVNFDGKEFKWNFSAGGLRAHELNLAQQHPPKNEIAREK